MGDYPKTFYSSLAAAQAAPDDSPCAFHPEGPGEHFAAVKGFGVCIVCAECVHSRQDLSYPWADA